jgi:hypothetical protein
MSIDDVLKEFVRFLDRTAFAGNLDGNAVLQRTDLIVYALTSKLSSKIGSGVPSFFDVKAQGGPGPIGPRHRVLQLIEYSLEAGTAELADAYRRAVTE